MTRSILVTGGAGFIGSHLIESLTRESRNVIVLDNLSTGKRENLAKYLKEGSVSFLQGDIRNASLVNQIVSKAEEIIHLAALVDHESCLRDPQLARDVNEHGTLGILEAARKHDVKSLVYASSAAVYGETDRLPISEDAPPSPNSPYGSSKLAGEEHCIRYLQSHGLRVKCLRFFNVFGQRQSARQYSGVITEFMKRLSQDQPPIIYGNGKQTRDFVSVKDVVQAVILALDSDKTAGVYNIATGKETSINSLAEILLTSTEKKLKPIQGPPRLGEIRRSVADITRAKAKLNFNPGTDLEKDLRELWNSQRAYSNNPYDA